MDIHASRLLVAAAVGGAALLGTTDGAGAVTAHTMKNETTLSAVCANGYDGSALLRRHVSTSKTHKVRWTVVHVVGKKDAKVLVPTAANVTFTFTSGTGTVTTNAENLSKKAKAGKQTTCTIDGTRSINGGSLSVDGTVTGAFH